MQNQTERNFIRLPAGWLREKAKRLAGILLPALAGFALARTGILGKTGVMKGIYPFGAAFAAAVPSGSAAPAIAGILLGFLLPGNDAETLRCAASALAAAGIKWALGELKPVKNSPFFSPAAAFAGVVLTGMVVTSSIGAAVSYDIVSYAAEGAMAAAGAYFFRCAMDGWIRRHSRQFTPQDIYCIAASLCIGAIPLCRIGIFGVSPVSMALMVLLMAAAGRLGTAGGGAAGIALGITLALADGRFALLGVTAIAGLASSLFSPLGSIALSAVFVISCALGVLASGEVDIPFLIEAAAAAIAFPIIRQERLAFIFDILEPTVMTRQSSKADGYMSRRLLEAARGLEDASRTVSEVSRKLDQLDAPKAGIVCRRATAELCTDCAISGFCWRTSRDETQRLFDSLSEILKAEGRLTRFNTPEPLRTRCARWGEMAEKINACYAEHVAGEGARRRVAQVRQAVAGQLWGCGYLLSDLAEDSRAECSGSGELSTLASEILAEYSIAAEDVSCVKRRDGSVAVTMTLRESEEYPEPEYDASEILSEELEINLRTIRVAREGGSVEVAMESCPDYKVSVGVSQHSRNGGRLCGDACKVLENTESGTFILLSDGMGTGGRAAVDSTMTCDLMSRLLTAGFSERGAMELVNSAMQISSGEETLVTLDCARINLYTGELTMSKAGAASSYILKKGKTEKLMSDSLPLGIMERIDSRTQTVQMEEGDVVIMTSDGASPMEEDWLASELERTQTEDMQRLARDIMALASARCADGEDDDMTVIAFRIDAFEENNRSFQAA